MPRFQCSSALVGMLSIGCLLGFPSHARASTITFTLDCTVSGPGQCTPVAPVGTITLTDDGDWVDVVASDPSAAISRFFLNYDPAKFPLPAGYSFTAAGATITTQQDGEGQGNYGMVFDLNINDNPDVNTFTTILKLQKTASPDVNLAASDFNFTDTLNGKLYAVVNPAGAGPQIGALTSVVTGEVPEPATLTLLGTGLLGIAVRRRRGQRCPRADRAESA